MNEMTPATASDARGVLKYVASLICPWRWLIAITCLLVVGVVFAFFQSTGAPVSTGMTIIRIGLAPGIDYLLQDSGTPLVPIEPTRALVARVSNPIFLAKVVGEAKFEPGTAEFSRKLASLSLRPVALADDRNVRVEVSAGSPADVAAVLRAVAEEVASAHDAIAQRRLDALRSNTEDMRRRMDLFEKSVSELGPKMLNLSREGHDQTDGPALLPKVAEAAEFWDKMRDRIQRNTILLEFTEKTVVDLEPGVLPVTNRVVAPARAALLAGLAMLLAIVVLIILLAPPSRDQRGPAEP